MPRFQTTPVVPFLVGVSLLLAVGGGCNSGPSYPATDLEGTFKVNGEPLPKGSLTFTPKDLNAGQAVGGSIVDGRYTAKQVPLGKVSVTFNATRDTGRKVAGSGSEPVPVLENRIPPKYRTGLDIDVAPRQKEHHFELNSK